MSESTRGLSPLFTCPGCLGSEDGMHTKREGCGHVEGRVQSGKAKPVDLMAALRSSLEEATRQSAAAPRAEVERGVSWLLGKVGR